MPSKRLQLVIAAIAVVLAVAAGVVAHEGLTAQLRPIRVVVAIRMVPPMTPLTASDLAVTTVPRGQLHGLWFFTPAPLVGKMTLYGLYPQEIVSPFDVATYSPDVSVYAARLTQLQADALKTADQAGQAVVKAEPHDPKAAATVRGEVAGTLAAAGAGTGAPGVVAPAQVAGSAPSAAQAAVQAFSASLASLYHAERLQAVTVTVTEPQGFPIVEPGDHITVYGTVADQQKRMAAFIVGDDVLVLGNLGTGANGAVNGAVSGTLVVALTPGDTERLMLAQQAGSLQLGLEPLGGQALAAGSMSSASLLGSAPTGSTAAYGTVPTARSPGAVVP